MRLFARIPCDPFDSLDTGNSHSYTSTVTIDGHSLIYMTNSRPNDTVSIDALNIHVERLMRSKKYTLVNVPSKSAFTGNSGEHEHLKKNSDNELTFWPFRSRDNDTRALMVSSNCDHSSTIPCNQVSSILHGSKFLRETFTMHTNAQIVVGDEYLLMSLSHLHSSNDQISSKRFTDNGELKYSLRSLTKFAPWIRYVYLGS